MKAERYNAALHYHAWLKLFADNKKKEEEVPEDCVRYEEQTDEEYLEQLEKFFKGTHEKRKDD
tara:strand:+ start:102 stop:290 length:189 start_codon:yes stop_codon:yes gene_type:complete